MLWENELNPFLGILNGQYFQNELGEYL